LFCIEEEDELQIVRIEIKCFSTMNQCRKIWGCIERNRMS